jgi:tRNA threonylcarbamoyladenosine biosynthesis protein TsaE
MIIINDESEMRHFGESTGKRLNGGEVIELVGDVGAGKTTFVRGLAMGMGVTETVQSPSFTINRVYDASGQKRLVHYDFYRLQDAGIMADELSDSITDPDTVTIIEWASAVEHVLPVDRLTITIQASGETARRLEINSNGDKSRQLMEQLV